MECWSNLIFSRVGISWIDGWWNGRLVYGNISGLFTQHRFSREHKNVILEEEENHDRTERLVVCPQGGAHQFVIENDETESELSLGSRSFLHRVTDQVRKRQKQSWIDATKDSNKHSVIWGMFMSSTLQASVFMGKNFSDNLHSIKNTEDLTMKQMFDISEKLVSEQSDEIDGVKTMNWENSSWKYLSLIGDEQVISLSNRKVYAFSDSVLCLGKINDNPQSNIAWEGNWRGSKVHWNTEPWIELMVSQLNSSGISSQDSLRCSSAAKSKNYCQDWVQHQRFLQDGLSSCRCSTTSLGDP